MQFGEMALIEGRRRHADVWADTAVVCLELPIDEFERFCERHPVSGERFSRNLALILAKRLIQANTKIELLEPLGQASPIAGFLERNPSGGIHHLCYEVADIVAARDRLKAAGARILGDGEPKIGAHGKPVLFLHPKDFNGTLVELEQA